MWLLIAVVGFALSAIANILDKYVLDKTISRPVVLVFYSTVWGALFLLLTPFFGFLSGPQNYFVALLAGAAFVAGLWASYIGIQKSEVSHMGPFIGAVIPIFVFIWGKFLFNEVFSERQIIAVVLLIFGSLIIASEKSAKHNGFHRALLWGLLGGLLVSVYAVAAKYIYNHNPFTTGFIWTQGAVGFFAALLVLSASVRATFKRSPKSEVRKNIKKIVLVAVDKFFGLAGLILVQYAIALGSVTLVYALAGVQYAILILLVAVISKIGSRFFSEEYSRGEIAQEFVAVFIIGIGLALLI